MLQERDGEGRDNKLENQWKGGQVFQTVGEEEG